MEKVREEDAAADVVSEVGRSNKLEEWPGRRVLRDRAATEAMVNKQKKQKDAPVKVTRRDNPRKVWMENEAEFYRRAQRIV